MRPSAATSLRQNRHDLVDRSLGGAVGILSGSLMANGSHLAGDGGNLGAFSGVEMGQKCFGDPQGGHGIDQQKFRPMHHNPYRCAIGAWTP